VVEIQVPANLFGGTLTLSVPPQWQITDAHPEQDQRRRPDRCSISNHGTRAWCSVGPGEPRAFSVTATGPLTSPAPELHTVYRRLFDVLVNDYPLT
jgi:hypothetical protein